MRPIEFRLWDKKYQKMGYLHLTETPFVSSALVIGGEITTDEGKGYTFQTRYEEEVSEWMQYTGVKDKEDTKIFEGDIVLASFDTGIAGVKCDRFVVTFHKGAFTLDDNTHHTLAHFFDVEVIGNKYEHPHLLETKE